MKGFFKSRPLFTGLLIFVVGTALLIGGWRLLSLGGTPYYLLAGTGYAMVGLLMLGGRRSALWLHALVFAGTVVWAFWEVGLDGWKLAPRLDVPVVIALWVSAPWIRRRLGGGPMLAGSVAFLAFVVVAAGVYGVAHTRQGFANNTVTKRHPSTDLPGAVEPGEWQAYGRTNAGTRHSPLSQITPDNVGQLQVAWRLRTGDTDTEGEGHPTFAYESTPLKVGELIYSCTPHGWVVAADATSGEHRWTFNPEADASHNYFINCRGVSYYQAPTDRISSRSVCRERIVAPVPDGRLVALDAQTGRLCPGFGDGGYIDLTEGLGNVAPGMYVQTSPPLVMHDKLYVGGNVFDNRATGEPSGVVRAYSAASGELVWSWDVGRTPPTKSLALGESYTRGTPNAWGVFTGDADLGLVYVPMGGATPDYYGAERRPIDDKFTSSLVALDAESGQMRWIQQFAHRDVWDYDTPIGPSLVDLPDGRGDTVPALLQTTKRGELFLLNRETGEPLSKIEEKPVPGGSVESEWLSKTQPYSVEMPSFAPKRLEKIDIWGATPFDQLWCRIQFNKLRYDGQFTPPTEQGSIMYPTFDGVIDWYGGSLDTRRNVLVVTTNYLPFTFTLIPRQQAVQEGIVPDWSGRGDPPPPKSTDYAAQWGLPYAVKLGPWLNPLSVPCNAPPWGTIAAVDMESRKLIWERPYGTTRDTGPFKTHFNLPLPTGVFNLGGAVTTQSGLIFISSATDQYLRAIDESSGEELWKARLPAPGMSTPIVYRGADGREFVLVTAGGHQALYTRTGDHLIAYALPGPDSEMPDGAS